MNVYDVYVWTAACVMMTLLLVHCILSLSSEVCTCRLKQQNRDDSANRWAEISPSHHFSDHHDVGSSLLVDGQDIHESHVPEDDIETIDNSPGDKNISPCQPQPEANKEGGDGQKVTYIEIVTEPHLYLLAYFACFRHKHLQNKRCKKDDDS